MSFYKTSLFIRQKEDHFFKKLLCLFSDKDLQVVVDVITVATERVMPEVANNILSQIASKVDDHAQEQLRELRQQNQFLLEQNRMLWQLCNAAENYGGQLSKVSNGSIVLIVRFGTAGNLDRFWQAFKSGELAKALTKCLICEDLEEQVGCKLHLRLTICEEEYMNGLYRLGKIFDSPLTFSL